MQTYFVSNVAGQAFQSGDAERDRLVGLIVNAPGNTLSPAELAVMPTEFLRGLVSLVTNGAPVETLPLPGPPLDPGPPGVSLFGPGQSGAVYNYAGAAGGAGPTADGVPAAEYLPLPAYSFPPAARR